MYIHESPLLLPGLLAAHPEDQPFDPSSWRVNEEVYVSEAAGELLLRQDSRTLRLGLTPQSGPLEGYAQDPSTIWVLARLKQNAVSLRCARPSQSNALEKPLEIGIDQRVADDLYQQRKSSAPTVSAALAWLTDEFVCTSPGVAAGRVFAAILPRARSGQLQLVGRASLLEVKRANDGRLLVERLRRRSQKSSDAYTVLAGEISFVDLAHGIRVQDGDERAMLEASVSSYGTYLELWQLYSDMEWRREVQAAAELGALRFTRCESASAEGGAWRFWADPAELAGCHGRWRALAQPEDGSVEAEEVAPDWGADRYTDLSTSDTLRRFRGTPEFQGGALVVFSRGPIEPPSTGFLFLSLGGDRKQHERRLHARRAIEAGLGVPRLRSLLQDLPIPGQRLSRMPALTPYARQSFKSGIPTSKQEEAIRIALNTPDVALIIGPPGTGKTQVIAALERRLAELNEGHVIAHEVLISSFQHDAVENALERTSVYGLPAIKVGNRSGLSDAVDHWCAARHQSVSHRLDQLEADEPHVPLLQRLNRMVMGLRLANMPADQREEAFRQLNALIEELAQKARIRLSSRWTQDWEEYLASRRGDGIDAGRRMSVGRRRRLTRLVRSLRVLPKSFSDDGAFCAGALLNEAGDEPGLLSHEQVELLTQAQNGDQVTVQHFGQLADLRDQLLDRLRLDNRPAAVRNQLDEVGVSLLDHLQAELASKLASTRFGRYDVLQRYRDAFDSSRDRVRRAVEAYSSIVGATCQQAASHHMGRLKLASSNEAGAIRFNTVIIDEAARANPLDLFIPMSMAKRRIVLVGDHRQLPHLLDAAVEDDVVRANGEEDRRQVYQQSLFERLWRQLKAREAADGFSRVVMLDTQFRMHPTLGDFVSKNFYESVGLGKIESGRKPEDFAPTVPGFGVVTCAWLDVPDRLGREVKTDSGSRQRPCEASRIAKEVRTLLLQLPPEMSVGVITFYAAQRDRIYEALSELGIAETGDSGWQVTAEHAGNAACPERLRVGTVDAFQGKEFDIVLLSAVRSNDLSIKTTALDDPAAFEKAASRKYGHLRVANRLNVAMSRQKRLLIAVGDRAMFIGDDARKAVPEMAAFVDLCDRKAHHVR